jgi:hypothetical protein
MATEQTTSLRERAPADIFMPFVITRIALVVIAVAAMAWVPSIEGKQFTHISPAAASGDLVVARCADDDLFLRRVHRVTVLLIELDVDLLCSPKMLATRWAGSVSGRCHAGGRLDADLLQ